MEQNTANDTSSLSLGADWFDPLEAGVRQRIRSFIEEMLEAELEAVLARRRYERAGQAQGYRHGHRERQMLGTFGPITVSVPRARLVGADGKSREWRKPRVAQAASGATRPCPLTSGSPSAPRR